MHLLGYFCILTGLDFSPCCFYNLKQNIYSNYFGAGFLSASEDKESPLSSSTLCI